MIAIGGLILEEFEALREHHKPYGFISAISIGEQPTSGIIFHITTKIKGKIMAISIKDTQQGVATLSFKDKKGADTDASSVTVTSSDESVATVSYDDPTNALTVVAGNPGVAELTIDAKDSAGNAVEFPATAIEVLPGEATAGTIGEFVVTEQP